MNRFRDRSQAGQQLAREVANYTSQNSLVLGLAHGGVPVAFELATAHQLPLDVIVVCKLSVPGQEEMAMGAIVSGGVRILYEDLIRSLNISDQQIAAAGAQAHKELQKRERACRGDLPELEITGRDVILVDEGLATGAVMAAAVAGIQAQKPTQLIAAFPTAAAETCHYLEKKVDGLVCILRPWNFKGVEFWYEDFSEVTDEHVKKLLEKARRSENARYFQD
jgi:putative phosphoribosyl transferase